MRTRGHEKWPSNPVVKRTVAFFDGQNLFHTAKEAFGYTYPNYDVLAIAALLFSQDQDLAEVAYEIREIAKEQDRSCIDSKSYFPKPT